MPAVDVEIFNTSIRIKGYKIGMSTSLEKDLSVYDPKAWKYTHWGYYYDEETEVLHIPSGVGVDTIKDLLLVDSIMVKHEYDRRSECITPRDVRNSLNSHMKPRDENQEGAIKFLLNPNKIKQRALTLATGIGKTYCTIDAISKLEYPALICSVNLSQQWVERIKEYTNCSDEEVVFIQGRKGIKELIKTPPHKQKGIFYVVSHDTLTSALRRDINITQKLCDACRIGIKVFDEFHEHFMKIIKIDTTCDVERTIYLSATPKRSNFREDVLYRKIFGQIPSHGQHTHNLNKYNILLIDYDSRPTENDKLRSRTKYGFNANKYFQYLFFRKDRINLFYNMVKRLLLPLQYDKADNQIFIYLYRIDHINSIKEMLEYDPDINMSIGKYCQEVKDPDERRAELKKEVILTTMPSARAGVDIKDLRASLVTVPFSSEVILRQVIGRLRSKDKLENYYMDFCDTGFGDALKQRNVRMKTLWKVAKSVKRITFDYKGNIVGREDVPIPKRYQ